jgi:molecular chaperone DnaK
MTITGGTALSQDKIDQMVKDAEAYAEEDAKRREAVETRNQADQLIHQTDKLLSEQGEQMTDDEKSAIESAVSSLKEAVEGEEFETDKVRARMDDLIQASQAMATRLYQEAAASQAAAGESTTAGDDDIVEAEIVDEDE